MDPGEAFGIVPLSFQELQPFTQRELVAIFMMEVHSVDGDRHKLQDKIVARLEQIKADLAAFDLIECTSFMKRTYDQSDLTARLFFNKLLELSEAYMEERPAPAQVFWKEFHDFLVLHLSQRDMEVLSDEYAYVGPMRIPHINEPLRQAMHSKWDLSLDMNREIVEHGYAEYIVVYADLQEKMRQDFMEQEEYEAQFKLDAKIDHQVKAHNMPSIDDYLQEQIRLDTERIEVGYNNLFKSQQQQ